MEAQTQTELAAPLAQQQEAPMEKPSAAAVQEAMAAEKPSVQETEESSVQEAMAEEEPSVQDATMEEEPSTEKPSAVQDAATTEEPTVKKPAKAAVPSPLQLRSPWSMRREPSEQHDVRLRLVGRGYNLNVWCDESVEVGLIIGAAFELLHRHYGYQDAHRAELEEAARKLHEARRTCPKQGFHLQVSSRDYDVGLRLSDDVPFDLMVDTMFDLVLKCALQKHNIKGAEDRKAETAKVTPTPGVQLYLTGIGFDLSVWVSNDVNADELVGASFEMLDNNIRNDLDADANRCAVSQDVELFVVTAGSTSKFWVLNKDRPTVLSTAAFNTLADHVQKKLQQAQDQSTPADQAERVPVKIEKPPTEMAIAGNSYNFACAVFEADDELCALVDRLAGLVGGDI